MPTCDSGVNRALGIETMGFPGSPGVRAGHFPLEGLGLIHGQGTKILGCMTRSEKKKDFRTLKMT